MAKKMNLCGGIITLMLLALIALNGIQARAIDDIDNSIDSGNEPKPRLRLEQDWIKFTKAPVTKMIQTPGTPLEIVCEVMGSQIPTISWVVTKGNEPLSETDRFDSNIISESSMSAIVRVRSVHIVDQMLTEKHTYTCIGRTGSKTIYTSTTVYPKLGFEKASASPQPPKIVYSEKLHLDLVGSVIQLPCKVYSTSKHVEILWLNGDGKLIQQNNRFKILPSGELLISGVTWADMGAYRCLARNSFGEDSSDTFVYPVLKEDN